ncbi:Com family DNA-binding transcriptional regulator [Collimonas sp. NPDC087041]|uniref:Com family DNA-binding transcriptional regulator n=1 Tax=Collimonas sp. NPDC087041 TaxID=3363960 RepID=UPI0037F6AF7C
MQDIRCGNCSKKLGEGEYIALAMKCPRCGTLNHLRAESSEPERHRVPVIGAAHGPQTTKQPTRQK